MSYFPAKRVLIGQSAVPELRLQREPTRRQPGKRWCAQTVRAVVRGLPAEKHVGVKAMPIEERIRRLFDHVEREPDAIGVLSTVAVLLDRKDLLDGAKFTMLEAVERLGDWFRAALIVQRSR